MKIGHRYYPTVTELRQAYEVAFGEYGSNVLIGTLFANLPDDTIERIYAQALAEVKKDLEEKELI
jgi:ribosomal protein S3AE